MTYRNNAFATTPVFTTGAIGDSEENLILPPLPDVEVQQAPGPPPNNMDGTVASVITTMAADHTIAPNAHVFIGQPVPTATLLEEVRGFQIFIGNSEIAMRSAAGEEEKLCML